MFNSWRLEISRWTGPKYGWAEFFSFYSGSEDSAKKLLLEYCRTMRVACKIKLVDPFGEDIIMVDAGEGAELDLQAVENSLRK